MAEWTPTLRDEARSSGQAELFNAINSRRLYNFTGEIDYLDMRPAPILAMLLMKLGGVTGSNLDDPDFKWVEQRPYYTDKYKFYSNATNAPACSASASGTA